MKHYRFLVIGLVIIVSLTAFIPAIAFPWQERINWQKYAQLYEPSGHSLYLPGVHK